MTTISGTQSPPLEATGEHGVMGSSSVDRPDEIIQVVPDKEQRKDYFEQEDESDKTKNGENKPAPKSQSLAHKLAEQGRQID